MFYNNRKIKISMTTPIDSKDVYEKSDSQKERDAKVD